MSHGLTPHEIAEQLQLPPALAQRWHARGYYGAVAHNVQGDRTRTTWAGTTATR